MMTTAELDGVCDGIAYMVGLLKEREADGMTEMSVSSVVLILEGLSDILSLELD